MLIFQITKITHRQHKAIKAARWQQTGRYHY